MDGRYRAIDHPIRRRILLILAESPKTYSRLLEDLEIESGHLAYHIRNLSDLLDKNEAGIYFLNREGIKAHSFLIGEEKKVTDISSNEKKILVSVFFLIVIITGAIIYGVSSNDRIAQLRFEEQKTVTYTKSLQALDIVYEIFEDWEIPREHWTELLLKIVEIKSNLDELYAFSGQEDYQQFSERLDYYETELSSVIVVGDPGYMTLTVEKRYLIRELHTLLMEIEEAL